MSINFTLSSTSPAIDSGTTGSWITSTTTDYAGNPIYGTPDIGAYEYQPPFTSGTSLVDPTGNIRIYGDRKYRYTTATSSTMSANFSVAPAETWTYSASTTRPEWLNISDITWNTSGTYSKQWTASSTSATTTVYTIGDLAPSTYYTIAVDGAASTTQQSNGSGVITYTYSGGYSIHTFTVTPDTTGSTAPTLSSPGSGAGVNTAPTFTWGASTDSESGLSKYQLYIDGALYADNLSSLSTTANNQSCGSHSWYVRAVDNAGNTTNSDSLNFSVICGGGAPGGGGGGGGGYSISPVGIGVSTSTLTASTTLLTASSTEPTPKSNPTSGLTQIQIDSILNLLKSFDAEKDIIEKVRTSLSGNFQSISNYQFSRNLTLGSVGEDVRQLQIFLNTNGFTVAKEGYGSIGNETTTFGSATRVALIKFQKANNINPAIGYFGVVTRGVVEKILSE